MGPGGCTPAAGKIPEPINGAERSELGPGGEAGGMEAEPLLPRQGEAERASGEP